MIRNHTWFALVGFTCTLFCVAPCNTTFGVEERQPIPGVFGTAFNNLGQQLSDRSVDPHYVLATSPLNIASTTLQGQPLPTYVSDSTRFPLGPTPAWPLNNTLSKWISPFADQTQSYPNGNLPAGDYVFQTRFNLDGFNPLTAQIEGRWISDNKGEIWLNGQKIGENNNLTNFVSFTIPAAPLTPSGAIAAITSPFVAGMNFLEFRVNNSFASPVGLRVEITSATAIVPEPAMLSSWIVVGVCAAMTFRRRRCRA